MKKTAKWKRILAVVLTALMVLCNQTVLFADTTVQDTEQETEIREEEPQEVEQDSEDTEYQEIEESIKMEMKLPARELQKVSLQQRRQHRMLTDIALMDGTKHLTM